MALCSISPNASRSAARSLLLLPAIALLLAGCEQKTKAKTVEARPVRTVTAAKGGVGETVVLTGQISAENEASLAFRIGGRIIERTANVGDRVTPDQVLAKLDPQNELNALALGAGGAVGRGRPAGRGEQHFRPPEDTCCSRASRPRPCSTRRSRRCARRNRRSTMPRPSCTSPRTASSYTAAQGGGYRLDHGALRRSRARWCRPDRRSSRSRDRMGATRCSTFRPR